MPVCVFVPGEDGMEGRLSIVGYGDGDTGTGNGDNGGTSISEGMFDGDDEEKRILSLVGVIDIVGIDEDEKMLLVVVVIGEGEGEGEATIVVSDKEYEMVLHVTSTQ